MSPEQKITRNSEVEPLTEHQGKLLRVLFVHGFKKQFYLFEEFEESSILFQTDLVQNKGEYEIIYPYEEIDYVAPYESLDMEFIEVFEKKLEDPDQKPINFRQEIIINKLNYNMPNSMKDYFGKTVETIETVYFLKPVDDKRRAIWQTTYLDQITGNPIAEIWEGIIEKKEKTFPKPNTHQIK